MKVVSLADAAGDARLWSVEQMLEDALADVRNGKRRANKAVVLFLDDSDEGYVVGFSQAGLTMSQMLALFDVGHVMALEELGWFSRGRHD